MALIHARQFHNQPVESHIHPFLVALWDQVRAETSGALDVAVHAQNAGIAGSDPAALDMLVAGEVEFITLMGGILGKVVPEAELQGVAFAFDSPAQVMGAMDGALGTYLADVARPHGIEMVAGGCFENGFRWMFSIDRPILLPRDLAGLRMRIPSGKTFEDLFRALGAVPVVVNIRELYDALATRRVDAQENAPVVVEVNRLYEVSTHASVTDHQWSGFNQLAHLGFWRRLPEAMRDIVRRATARQVALQRAHADAINRRLAHDFPQRGMQVHRVERDAFRQALADAGFFRDWRDRLGPVAWGQLTAAAPALRAHS